MKNRNNTYQILRELAYAWDEGPVSYLEFKNRIFSTYGREYVRNKLGFIEGDIIEESVEPRYQHYLNRETHNVRSYREKYDDSKVQMMETPTDGYEQWLYSVPDKDIRLYQKKKAILDKYLDCFSNHDKDRLIRVMKINNDSPSYVSFIDLNPDLMTTQQMLIYKDIIKYYELQNYKDLIKDKELWTYFNEAMNAFDKERMDDDSTSVKQYKEMFSNESLSGRENISIEEEVDYDLESKNNRKEFEEIFSINGLANEELKSANDILRTANSLEKEVWEENVINRNNVNIQANMNNNSSLNSNISSSFYNTTNVNNSVDNNFVAVNNMRQKLDYLSSQLSRQNQLLDNQLREQAVQNGYIRNQRSEQIVNNFYDTRFKPLVFNYQTSPINAKNIFGTSNDYLPSSSQNIIPRNIVLTNPEIKSPTYVTNIADLIAQRDQIMLNNSRLVNEIIQKQIAYNNQYLSNAMMNNSPIANSQFPNSSIFSMQQNQNAVSMNQANTPANNRFANANGMGALLGNSSSSSSTMKAVPTIQANGTIASAISLSKIKNASASTSAMNQMSMNMNQSLSMKPEQVVSGEKQSISSILGNWSVKKASAAAINNQDKQQVKSKQQNKDINVNNEPKANAQGIRPYKPNLANAIRKVEIPTKKFNKFESEPNRDSKEKIINNISNNANNSAQQQNEVTNEKVNEGVMIPSKKIV